jgi:hypothetical protein
VFFFNGPKPIQTGHQEDMFTHSISAKPQQRPKNRHLLPLSTNVGKKIIAASSQVILKPFFCFDFLHIGPSNHFCFCKFFAKSFKSEGERLI